MSFWDTLDPQYRLILCDVWGVIHDGVQLYAGAAARLRQWRSEGRTVILITNAPRPVAEVERQLLYLGLPRDAWDEIATSGEAGIAALNALGTAVGFIGTGADRAVLERGGVRIADDEGFTELACVGLEEARPEVQEYRADLESWAESGVHMHCLNPDRIVVYDGVAEPCAGALADVYEALGGRVTWYGKPYPAIYRHALRLAGDPPVESVLAIGDAIQTDALGAARMGFAFVFVAGGIHAGEGLPVGVAANQDLSDWLPLAVVDGLE